MYLSFGLFFFWRKCSTVVAVGVQTSFLLFCKKCDRKKQQQGGCAEAGIKTVQAVRYERRGFISGWGKKPVELPVIEFQA